uniref:BURP domain-containing protein n=2 Tax=Aegilops tauschii subsp. strangulata TaxID=200361 RepID=A0A453TC08_AEGTS
LATSSLVPSIMVASVDHAAGAPTPEQYWKSALPDTPMPSSLSQLLSTSSASAGEHRKPGGTAVGIWAFHYFDHYDATETHLQHIADDPSAALFFLEKDLQMHYTGRKKLTKVLHFMATSGAGERFLPRSEADAIPFSSGQVPEILSRFSVKPNSPEAAGMARTLHVCEAPAAEGEKKWCATSLESMVDFATSSLGTRHVRAVSTVVGKDGTPRQEYTLTGVKRAGDDQLVVCHVEPYAYAVFACHLTQATRAYSVPTDTDTRRE